MKETYPVNEVLLQGHYKVLGEDVANGQCTVGSFKMP